MKLMKTDFVDIPISLFYYRYGINIDDALDLCHERGKILSPVIGKKINVSTGTGNIVLKENNQEFYLMFLSGIMIKNNEIVSFKEELVKVD